ncbi:MAG: aldose epimerase family protein [Oscillospiraceae bacterium]
MLTAEEFGKTAEGEGVMLFRLTNTRGAYIEVLSYGCALRAVCVPDKNGRLTNVCLGYATLAEYESHSDRMGAIVGRTSGRIRNARFELGGVEYRLTPNVGENQLHGGPTGFDSRVWKWRARGDGLVFYRRSDDGEEGYPGNLEVEISYDLSDDGQLAIGYLAHSDADTYCSLTSHAYWNLGCTLEETLLRVRSDEYVEAGGDLMPTGRLLPVADTPFDFRRPAPIAAAIDHSFPLDGTGLREACSLRNPENGIALTIFTTLPSIHVYTGDSMPAPRSGVALEAQFIPNGMNTPAFPSPLLRSGEVWDHKTVIVFE